MFNKFVLLKCTIGFIKKENKDLKCFKILKTIKSRRKWCTGDIQQNWEDKYQGAL